MQWRNWGVSRCQVTGGPRALGGPDESDNHKNCSSFIRNWLTKNKQAATTTTAAELLVNSIIVIEIQIFCFENSLGT